MIRKFRPDDFETFLAMSLEFYSSDAVMAPVPEEYHTRAWNELMRSDEYLLGYIFEDNGYPAGFALLNKTFQHEAGGPVVWIEELYVRPEYRSKGIGGQFFDFLSSPEGPYAAWLRLEIEPDNTRALQLYSRKGFVRLPYAQLKRLEPYSG